MSIYGRDPWGGPLEVSHAHSSATHDPDPDPDPDPDLDRGALSRTLDETQQSWLLAAPGDRANNNNNNKKKYVDLGCLLLSRKLFLSLLAALLAAAAFAAFVSLLLKALPRRHRPPPPPDTYSLALQKALLFFNAQRSGPLPRHNNNVSWRGPSAMKDGLSDPAFRKSLVGGFYDAGHAIKFHFPASFSVTLLSWSVIEYSAKYQAAGQLAHVTEIIKWGADYLLKTFNSSAHAIDSLAAQVGTGATASPNDRYCWMRPEDMDYPRPVYQCTACSDLAAEMAAALASASIVFKDANQRYSRKLLRGATTLFKFSRDRRGRYSAGGATDASFFYNSTGYWDEFLWGGRLDVPGHGKHFLPPTGHESHHG